MRACMICMQEKYVAQCQATRDRNNIWHILKCFQMDNSWSREIPSCSFAPAYMLGGITFKLVGGERSQINVSCASVKYICNACQLLQNEDSYRQATFFRQLDFVSCVLRQGNWCTTRTKRATHKYVMLWPSLRLLRCCSLFKVVIGFGAISITTVEASEKPCLYVSWSSSIAKLPVIYRGTMITRLSRTSLHVMRHRHWIAIFGLLELQSDWCNRFPPD